MPKPSDASKFSFFACETVRVLHDSKHATLVTLCIEKQKGIKLSDATEDCLTNLRFADDVLLFSTSLEKLREMLCEFKTSTEAVGLGIHPDKTKILSNQEKIKAKDVEVDNIKIEILGKQQVRDTLGKRSHSRIKKRKKSKTD